VAGEGEVLLTELLGTARRPGVKEVATGLARRPGVEAGSGVTIEAAVGAGQTAVTETRPAAS
jgi:hypothetical protein